MRESFLVFFLIAIMLAGWFGRTAGGLSAVFVSMLAVDYYFIPPYRALEMESDQIPYFLSFLLSAVITSSLASARRSAEEKQRQKARAELAHLSRITTMGELAASIAHEINQPIGAIVTNADAARRWLAHTPPNSAAVENILKSIAQDANRAAEVIGRIRSLLQKNPTPMVPLHINDVIRDVLAITAHDIGRAGVTVTTDLSANLPLIVGDRVQLQQVMLNLILNSLDAMSFVPEHRRHLNIKSSRNADRAIVQVEDSGQGWEAQHVHSIFDPFFTTKENGIGMGLTISRSLIEAHGGRLWAEARKPHGAILKFTLPVLEERT